MKFFENLKNVKLRKRFIIMMALFPVAVFVIALLFFFLYGIITFKPQAVEVTNITPYSATISWVTKAKTQGSAIVSDKESSLPFILDGSKNNKSFDDRDWFEAEQKAIKQSVEAGVQYALNDEEITQKVFIPNLGFYNVHHVTLKNLTPETQYYVYIGNGNYFKEAELEISTEYAFTTLAETESLYAPDPAYGKVTMWGSEEPMTDGIVYLELENRDTSVKSTRISSVLSDNGTYYFDLNVALGADSKPYLTSTTKNDNVEHFLTVEVGKFGRFTKYAPLYMDAPFDDIVIGAEDQQKNADYELKYFGNKTVTTSNTLLNGFINLVYAADCGENGGAKPCSQCQPSSGCDQGVTLGAGGETWGPGYMQYCAERNCTIDDPDQGGDDCECACQGRPETFVDNVCGDGKECRSNKCETKVATTTQEPVTTGGAVAVAAPAACAGYGDGITTWGLNGSGNIPCPSSDACSCHCNNNPSETCTPGTNCECLPVGDNVCCMQNGSPTWMPAEACRLSGNSPLDAGRCVTETPTAVTPAIDPSTADCCDASGTPALVPQGTCPKIPISKSACGVNVPQRGSSWGACCKSGSTITANVGLGSCALGEATIYTDQATCEGYVACNGKSEEVAKNDCKDGWGECKNSQGNLFCFQKDPNTGEPRTYTIYPLLVLLAYPASDAPRDPETPAVVTPSYHTCEEKLTVIHDNDKTAYCSDNCGGNCSEHQNCIEGSFTYRKPCDNGQTGCYSYDTFDAFYCKDMTVNKTTDYMFWSINECNAECNGSNQSCKRLDRYGTRIGRVDCEEDNCDENMPIECSDNTKKCECFGKYCIVYYARYTCETTTYNQRLDQIFENLISFSSPVFAQETTSITYSPENGTYVFPDVEGQYRFIYENQEYVVNVTNTEAQYLIYIDQNGNEIYEEDFDVILATDPIELEFSRTADVTTYDIKKGFNYVSFDFMPTDFDPTSEGILTYLNNTYNNSFYSISKFNPATGGWDILGSRDGTTYGTANFQIAPGLGYVLRSSEKLSITIPGNKVISKVPISLSKGWNLIALHGTETAYTAQSLIKSIDDLADPDFDADNVTKWDSSKGRYEGLQVTTDDNGIDSVYGYDFTLYPLQGYFIRIMQGEGRWTPE